MEDYSKYTHSPAHLAVVLRDHVALRRIVTDLPRLAKAGEVTTEAESMESEARADSVSAVIDRWSALQEAVCTREEAIAMIIARHYQPLAWAKWCRRLPRIIASASRIRDFYMEIIFHFESSVIPFVGRIAPSSLSPGSLIVLSHIVRTRNR